jgi:hypothetical protein
MENYIYGVITGLVASLIGFVIYQLTKDTNGIQKDNDMDWEA